MSIPDMFDPDSVKYVALVAIVSTLFLCLAVFGDMFWDWDPVTPYLPFVIIFVIFVCVAIGITYNDDGRGGGGWFGKKDTLDDQVGFFVWLTYLRGLLD